MSTARFVSTQGELATALGKTRRTVIDYLDSGMRDACYTDFGYDLEAARLWVKANKRQRAEPTESEVSPDDLRAAQYAKIKQEERKLRLKNDEIEGRLVYADDVQREVGAAFLRIKTRMEAIPNELEMIFPAEIRAQMKCEVADRVRLILLEMAAFRLEEANEAEGGDDHPQ